MKEPEYHHPSNPNYHYPSTSEHVDGLALFVSNAFVTLAQMFGDPLMDGRPDSWSSVVTRHLYPDIPVSLWGSSVKVVAFVPYEIVTHIMAYANGRFPAWLEVKKAIPVPNVKHEDEGLEYLRKLLAGGEPEIGPSLN